MSAPALKISPREVKAGRGPFENSQDPSDDIASIDDPRFNSPEGFLREMKKQERRDQNKRKVRGAYSGSVIPGPETEWFQYQMGPFENKAAWMDLLWRDEEEPAFALA